MALALHDIDHRYGRSQSLRGVSLTLRPGDCYGFLGHNGAGKTTALRIALGLQRQQRGRIEVDGVAARRLPRAARARIGGTVETMRFYGWVSALDNLTALARVQGLGRRDARREAERALTDVGLTGHGRRRVRAFSQGMRQRLGIAQALLGRPRYLLLDEPHNGLDPEAIADLRALLRHLAQDEGHGVLVSSHQLLEVAELCTRVGVLREGKMLLEASTDDLLRTAEGRVELATDAPAAARAVLDAMGLRCEAADGGALQVELGSTQPRDLVARLVHDGIGIDRIAPRPVTLEEIYLGLQHDPAAAAPTTPPPPAAPLEAASPAPQAPGGLPILAVWRHELHRHGRRLPVLALLGLPCVFAWRRIAGLADDAAQALQQVERGDLFSTTTATGFEALGRGIAAGLPVLTLTAAAFGSQALAGDLTQGTLRNLLVRPLRRSDVVFGKALAVATALLVSCALLVATAWSCGAAHFAFGDRMEVYGDGTSDLWLAADDIAPEVLPALLSPVLPVLGYGLLGLLLGALVPRAVWALATALGVVTALDLGRAAARGVELEPLLLSTYQPSPIGDTSYLAFFTDLALGNAEAFYEFGDRLYTVPATWSVASLALAVLLLARRRIP